MFKFVKNGDKLNIVGANTTFSGVSAYVLLQNNFKIPLAVTTVSEDKVVFSDDKAVAEVTVIEKDGIVTFFAKGNLVRDRSKNQFFDNAKTNLNSHGSFHLNFEGIDGLESYTVSNLKTFWTDSDVIGGDDLKNIPNETQAMLYKVQDKYGYMICPCDKKYKAVLVGSENGFSARLQSYKCGMMEFEGVLFFLAIGDEPYSLPEKATEFGLKYLGKKAKIANKRRYPETFEYLGWCSWDAFPYCVSHEGILEKAEEFKTKNIPVRWGIIDDMWATLDGENSAKVMHDRKLVSFKADPKQFPKGLKAAFTEVKEKYGLQMGIWHPLTGYWYGFHKDGETARECAKYLAENEDGRLAVKPTVEDMFGYHNHFYTYLKDAGTDFVKVDNQSSIDWFYRNTGTVGEVANAVHTGIEGAVGLNFDGTIINCMGCASENLWNRPNSVINRCSGDFLPENRNWFIDHIIQCTFTCYFYSGLFKGDFDMFWTDDGQAVKNCVLRAISGGPVYVSDKVGRSVAERLLPLALADGRLLRCKNSCVPTYDSMLEDPRKTKRPYKVWNLTENGFVMAAFNVDHEEKPVSGSMSPFELLGADNDKYLAFDFFNQSAEVLKNGTKIDITLNNYDDFKFYNFIPVNNGVALIGLVDKYVTSATYDCFGKNKYTVKNGGKFAVYFEQDVPNIFVDGEKVVPTKKDNYYLVDLGRIDVPHILEFEF